jgi:hypothetical protein
MNDVDLWRAAVDLMNAHGTRAEAEALRRGDAALDGGDIAGFNRWKKVARLIAEMQTRKSPPDKDVH